MIGSPDLLAFTGAEGFGEGEDEAQALPEELSVPLIPPGHPWSSSAQFPRDFILVAEFSEQVMDFYLLWYFFACVFFFYRNQIKTKLQIFILNDCDFYYSRISRIKTHDVIMTDYVQKVDNCEFNCN